MTTKDSIAEYVLENRMASVMNRTKWRELADVMTSNQVFEPRVRLKYLLDAGSMPGFSHLDWEWVKSGDSRVIEWLEIDPVRRDYAGRLVDSTKVDFTEWVRQALLSKTIPFEELEGIFKIRGYIRPNA